MIRVKICCISSVEEAQLAMDFGASALGLVGEMPSGPGPIPDELIFKIARTVPPPVATFLLTKETDGASIAAHHQKVHTSTIQIVDTPEAGAYARIRERLGMTVKLVQVIHVLNEKSVEEAVRAADEVDALLLDSGNPNLAVKELGGTGRTHNWLISRQIVEQAGKPVFLAGGLNAANVASAIEAVQPFGVDLCSGVRTNGHLDPFKLEQFFKAVGSMML